MYNLYPRNHTYPLTTPRSYQPSQPQEYCQPLPDALPTNAEDTLHNDDSPPCSKFITSDDVLAKYPKLRGDSKMGALAVALARSAILGRTL